MVEQKTKEAKAVIIDGKDLILGRMGSKIAKRLLMGEEIKIVNCKDIIMLGKKKFLVQRYKEKISNKVVKQGPYYDRSPADIVKRSMRNMLPYKNERGKLAFSRLKCYNSTPSTLLNVEKEELKEVVLNEDTVFYYTRIGELCAALGYDKHMRK
ncbi:50S ribosomal protein L13 [Candidatus Woesearchaeota archaeon]|nr:50S ribosomal protein L13 [Nanoarchaeota archaeon]MCB9370045.1 50S ribosomal protein L13 [Candidatus Woesearchaeota archaeon]USN44576.1 MAG: 50S ribosomal protein L13 [Candidatus Woesearchaeota archaeon]